MKKSGLLALLALLPLTLLAQDFDNVEIETIRLTDAIYMLTGEGGNIGLCIGDDATFIIDDQFAPLTEKIKQAIAALTEKPVQFVLNTHWHFDHSDGNENFGGEGAIIISHENSRKRMSEDQLIALFDRAQPAYSDAALPKITFTESMQFHLNGQTIDVFHRGHAHTDGDAIIRFVEANVFHMGDVFVRYGLPFIDQPNGGSIDGMISTLEYVAELADESTQFIPGHGGLSTKADMIEFISMLKTIRERIWTHVEQGKTLEETIASEPTKGFEDNGVGSENFVKIVYDSLRQRD